MREAVEDLDHDVPELVFWIISELWLGDLQKDCGESPEIALQEV